MGGYGGLGADCVRLGVLSELSVAEAHMEKPPEVDESKEECAEEGKEISAVEEEKKSGGGGDGMSVDLLDDMDLDPTAHEAAQPKPKAKAKSRAAAKKKGGKGEVHCLGCGFWRKSEFFSVSQTVCSECKKYLDRIYGFCQRQGEMEWWASQRRDTKKTKKMLDHYRDLLARSGYTTGGGTPKFSVAEAKEIIRTENRAEFLDKGRLMWEVQAGILVCPGAEEKMKGKKAGVHGNTLFTSGCECCCNAPCPLALQQTEALTFWQSVDGSLWMEDAKITKQPKQIGITLSRPTKPGARATQDQSAHVR